MTASNISNNQFFPYRNVIETLVIEELQRQLEARYFAPQKASPTHQPLKYTNETQAMRQGRYRLRSQSSTAPVRYQRTGMGATTAKG